MGKYIANALASGYLVVLLIYILAHNFEIDDGFMLFPHVLSLILGFLILEVEQKDKNY